MYTIFLPIRFTLVRGLYVLKFSSIPCLEWDLQGVGSHWLTPKYHQSPKSLVVVGLKECFSYFPMKSWNNPKTNQWHNKTTQKLTSQFCVVDGMRGDMCTHHVPSVACLAPLLKITGKYRTNESSTNSVVSVCWVHHGTFAARLNEKTRVVNESLQHFAYEISHFSMDFWLRRKSILRDFQRFLRNDLPLEKESQSGGCKQIISIPIPITFQGVVRI